MKSKNFIIVFLLFGVVSCSPIPYYLNVDMKKPSEHGVSIENKNIAVVTAMAKGGRDSLLLSAIAFGAAEKIEEEKGLGRGVVPVFTVYSDELNVNDEVGLSIIAVDSNVDLLMVIDSLSVGSYFVRVDRTVQEVQKDVMLPFKVNYKVFNLSSFSYPVKVSLSDTIISTVIGANVSDIKAVAKANQMSNELFKRVGASISSTLFPQWEEQSRMVIYYNNDNWEKALDYARDFRWVEARNIWIEEAKSPSPQKSACAAFNIALACEMLGEYGLARKWLDFAEEKYPFSDIKTMREIIDYAEKSSYGATLSGGVVGSGL